MDQTDLKNQKLIFKWPALDHCDKRRRSMGKQILSKEVLYFFLFAIATGVILVWRLFSGA